MSIQVGDTVKVLRGLERGTVVTVSEMLDDIIWYVNGNGNTHQIKVKSVKKV